MNSTCLFLLHAIFYGSRYLPEDKSTDVQEGTNNNFCFEKISSGDRAFKLKNFRISAVKVLRNLHKREELCENYGSDYSFSELVAQ